MLLTVVQVVPSVPLRASTQQAIRIAEVPAMSVTKDWWDRSAIILTGLLVGVGLIGTAFAYRTLRVIERQTAALIENQRPKIAV